MSLPALCPISAPSASKIFWLTDTLPTRVSFHIPVKYRILAVYLVKCFFISWKCSCWTLYESNFDINWKTGNVSRLPQKVLQSRSKRKTKRWIVLVRWQTSWRAICTHWGCKLSLVQPAWDRICTLSWNVALPCLRANRCVHSSCASLAAAQKCKGQRGTCKGCIWTGSGTAAAQEDLSIRRHLHSLHGFSWHDLQPLRDLQRSPLVFLHDHAGMRDMRNWHSWK